MQYEVIGANAATGKDVAVIVEASSFRDAESKASDLGVLVADVRPAETPSKKLGPLSVHRPPPRVSVQSP